MNRADSDNLGTRLASRPITFVATVQLAAMAAFGPLDAWIRQELLEHMSAVAARTLVIVPLAAIVIALFVRSGWWGRLGRPSGAGLAKAALLASIVLAYLLFRVGRWHRLSTMEVFLTLATAAAVATSEELIWRGWILGTLKSRFRILTAVVASSVLFGMAHLAGLAHGVTPVVVVVRVLWSICFGMFFAGLLVVSRSYWAPIAAHAVFNSAAAFTRGSRFHVIAPLATPIDMLIAAPAFVLVGLYLCLPKARRKWWLPALGCYAALVAVGVTLDGAILRRGTVAVAPNDTSPRVVEIARSADPLEFALTLELPAAYRSGLDMSQSRSDTPLLKGEPHTPGSGWPRKGEVLIWMSPLDRAAEDAFGSTVKHTVQVQVPRAGHWVIRVFVRDTQGGAASDGGYREIWQKRVETE